MNPESNPKQMVAISEVLPKMAQGVIADANRRPKEMQSLAEATAEARDALESAIQGVANASQQ